MRPPSARQPLSDILPVDDPPVRFPQPAQARPERSTRTAAGTETTPAATQNQPHARSITNEIMDRIRHKQPSTPKNQRWHPP